MINLPGSPCHTRHRVVPPYGRRLEAAAPCCGVAEHHDPCQGEGTWATPHRTVAFGPVRPGRTPRTRRAPQGVARVGGPAGRPSHTAPALRFSAVRPHPFPVT